MLYIKLNIITHNLQNERAREGERGERRPEMWHCEIWLAFLCVQRCSSKKPPTLEHAGGNQAQTGTYLWIPLLPDKNSSILKKACWICSSSIILKPLASRQKQGGCDFVTPFTFYCFPACPSLFFQQINPLLLHLRHKCHLQKKKTSVDLFGGCLWPWSGAQARRGCSCAGLQGWRHELHITCAGSCSREERVGRPLVRAFTNLLQDFFEYANTGAISVWKSDHKLKFGFCSLFSKNKISGGEKTCFSGRVEKTAWLWLIT